MRKRRRQPISNINVVPYLDVMLVLLVIFMITAPLFNQGVVDIPSVGDKAALPTQKDGALEIVYDSSGTNRFRLIDHDRDSAESELLSLPELMGKMEEEKLLRPDAPVVIQADGNLRHREVQELYGKLLEVGFLTVGIKLKAGQ